MTDRITIAAPLLCLTSILASAASDPGVRPIPSELPTAYVGGPLPGLDTASLQRFQDGRSTFQEVEGVVNGLGPRFNADSCVTCHAYPTVGGSSAAPHMQVDAATRAGASNIVPLFVTPNGPVKEVRFTSDGAVHDLFTITGRSDASGCQIQQTDYSGDLAFRVPTPLFGLGLVDETPDATLVADQAANADRMTLLGIRSKFNHDPSGAITRFGWKAQDASLEFFVAEAYNVEMGVTSGLFPRKRDDVSGCTFNSLPEDGQGSGTSDVDRFTDFIRFSAPPTIVATDGRGQTLFVAVGCSLCHVPSHTTSPLSFVHNTVVTYSSYSDFALHDVGTGDRVAQGQATGDEFRTAPLWGLGQRIFLMHDGRVIDLSDAIASHRGEASAVIQAYEALSDDDRQAVLDFLRSL